MSTPLAPYFTSLLTGFQCVGLTHFGSKLGSVTPISLTDLTYLTVLIRKGRTIGRGPPRTPSSLVNVLCFYGVCVYKRVRLIQSEPGVLCLRLSQCVLI